MSTVVIQGLQSCLESPVVESTTLRLKLFAPKSPSNDTVSCNWSFFQSLSAANNPASVNETLYLPQTSWSTSLSYKSLELCTESLGSESGADIIDPGDIFSPGSSRNGYSSGQSTPTRDRCPRKIFRTSRDLPPPLTTIRGSNSILVRSRRQDGRLIMDAVESPHNYGVLQAERSHGRLRLSFASETTKEEEEEELESENAGDEGEGEEERDLDGNSYKLEAEMGRERFRSPNSNFCCKDCGTKGLCYWEPFWVATTS